MPRRLIALVRDVAGAYVRTSTSQFAAAISYRALFSLVPIATFVVTVAGLFLRGDAERQRFVNQVAHRLELGQNGVAHLDRIVADVPAPWSVVGLVALVVALWGATGVMTSVRKALAAIFDDGVTRSFAHGKLVDAVLVVGVLLLMLASVGLSLLEQLAARVSDNVEHALDWQPGGVGFMFGVVVPLVVTGLVFAGLYRFLPRATPAWRDVAIGAVSAAVGVQAVQAGLNWYLAGPADFTKVYGSAGAIFAFLLYVYLSALAFLLGALLVAALPQPTD